MNEEGEGEVGERKRRVKSESERENGVKMGEEWRGRLWWWLR